MSPESRENRFLTDFLFAGTSGLLLSIAHLYPQYRLISFFALIPFLWQARQVTLIRSITLGSILATSFYTVSFPMIYWGFTSTALYQFAALNILFVLYGAIVNRLGKQIELNIVLMAVLWLPLEFVMTRYVGIKGVMDVTGQNTMLFIKIGSLFGVLFVSFLVVLINWLIIILFENVLTLLRSNSPHAENPPQKVAVSTKHIFFEFHTHLFPPGRAPPACI